MLHPIHTQCAMFPPIFTLDKRYEHFLYSQTFWKLLAVNENDDAVRLFKKYKKHSGRFMTFGNANHLVVQDIEAWLNQNNTKHFDYSKYFDHSLILANSHPRIIEKIKEFVEIDNMHPRKRRIINWSVLSVNPGALDILEANPHKVDWSIIALNPNPRAIQLMINHCPPSEYNWEDISSNPHAAELFSKSWYVGYVDLRTFCKNPHDGVLDIIEGWTETGLFTREKWSNLSGNTNPRAIQLLKNHVNKIDWKELSANPSAFDLLKSHPHEIRFDTIASNPHVCDLICVLDLGAMREQCRVFAEELARYVFRPERLLRLCDTHGLDLVDYIEILEGANSE